MFELTPYTFKTSDGVWLTLHHPEGVGATGRKPVLLLHGASANHLTFMMPTGDRNLTSTLVATEDFDPWLLNWRGSNLVFDDERNDTSINDRFLYDFNHAAQNDVKDAIAYIQAQTNWSGPVCAIGFCMGAAVLAEAIARGCVDGQIDRVVLMTLGLFFEVPIDGRLKGEDRTLEDLENAQPPRVLGVDPRPDRKSWPKSIAEFYDRWPRALKGHDEDEPPAAQVCNRVSFMFGMPYNHDNLVDEIHEDRANGPVLSSLFGAIPLNMYIHGAKNIRKGRATFYNKEDAIVTPAALDKFSELKKITLITGEMNRIWHRDSIDRMYEWLMRGPSDEGGDIVKHVLAGYAHQDLLWGKNSADCVFGLIMAGLTEPELQGSASPPKASQSV
jgi:pimeloyl-ACP methyl ester carboxylesterase